MSNEKEVIERALTRPTPPQGTYLMPFTTEEQLIKDVAFKWQNATNIMILKHEFGSMPVMHTRQIRNPVMGYSCTKTHYTGKWRDIPTQISNEKRYMRFCLIYAFIDGSYAYVKPMSIEASGAIS